MTMDPRFRLGMIALALAGISATGAVQTPDSAERFARVRLVVTTTAAGRDAYVGRAAKSKSRDRPKSRR